ncbi:MAG: type III-A CRISPR-associated protein Csm2 [Planctomycetota bacterium]|nr:type III-A CRISPR-associated protein Csm2 [Planctomycetota bacterium]
MTYRNQAQGRMGPGRPPGGRDGAGGGRQAQPATWQPFSLFEDKEKTRIAGNLLDQEAEKWACDIYNGRGRRNSVTQLRRFFSEIRRIEKIVRKKGFDDAKPLIRMFPARAAYARGRDNITDRCQEFLSRLAVSVGDGKDFEAAVRFFEAFLGYYIYLDKTKGGAGGGREGGSEG